MTEETVIVVDAVLSDKSIVVPAEVSEEIVVPGGIEVEALQATENGDYNAPAKKAYNPVKVRVPVPTLDKLTATENGDYTPEEGHAFSEVKVGVPIKTEESLTVVQNGDYTPESGKVYNHVVANVPNTYTAQDEGKVVSGGALVAQGSQTVTENDTTYDTTLINSLTVKVAGDTTALQKLIDRTITSIEIPNGTTTIGESIFRNCSFLKSVSIPVGVTSIAANAFYACIALQSITIPATVTSFGSSALRACSGMQSMTFLGLTPPTAADAYTFRQLPASCVIHVPAGSLNAYKTAANYPDPNIYSYVEDTE